MTSKNKNARSSHAPAPRLVMERTYRADIETVWDLWTTPEGSEAWWGPSGFEVTVRKLDLRPGGQLLYAMTATAHAQVDFVRRAGMPVTIEAHITYTEVVPQRRLAYTQLADFMPGLAPYDVSTTVDLYRSGQSVRMVLIFDAMHDEEWTQRAVMMWESELGKLAKVLGK
jgi:uncharacterized protein YndB with AHSA1/START domain